MSKSEARWKNPPVAESDGEDSMEEVPATSPETGAPEMRPVEPIHPKQEEMAAVGGSSPPPDTCSLLALARAAYPNLEGAALDSLALERLLSLVRELGIALTIAEETDITSLRVAQNIQAHIALRQSPSVAACLRGLTHLKGRTSSLLSLWAIDTEMAPGVADWSNGGGRGLLACKARHPLPASTVVSRATSRWAAATRTLPTPTPHRRQLLGLR
ncbi:unnamed protein product [Lampetra planeri]